MTELALQGRPKRGARFGSTEAGLRAKGLAGVNQRGEEWPINGPLGHNGGDEQILGAK